jgi:hypothetical protein
MSDSRASNTSNADRPRYTPDAYRREAAKLRDELREYADFTALRDRYELQIAMLEDAATLIEQVEKFGDWAEYNSQMVVVAGLQRSVGYETEQAKGYRGALSQALDVMRELDLRPPAKTRKSR